MTAEDVADSAINSKTQDYVSGLSGGLKEKMRKAGGLTYCSHWQGLGFYGWQFVSLPV